MFFVFDVETIPDFEFVRQVIKNPEDNEDDLLIQASEELARNSSGFLPPCITRWSPGLGSGSKITACPSKR